MIQPDDTLLLVDFNDPATMNDLGSDASLTGTARCPERQALHGTEWTERPAMAPS